MPKLSLGFKIMLVFWSIVFLAGIWIWGVISNSVMDLIIDNKNTFFTSISLWSDIIFILILLCWNIVSYRKGDIRKFTKKYEGEVNKSVPFYFRASSILADFKKIRMMAIIDRPWLFLIFSSPTLHDTLTVAKRDAFKEYYDKYSITPEKVYTASKIGFFAPFESSYRLDMEIERRNKKNNFSPSGINEIDNILTKHLSGENDFHGRLKIDDKILNLTVIGGSWLGGKFGNRIKKGYEIIRDLYEELKGQFPQSNDSEVDVSWNQRTGEFELIKKEQ